MCNNKTKFLKSEIQYYLYFTYKEADSRPLVVHNLPYKLKNVATLSAVEEPDSGSKKVLIFLLNRQKCLKPPLAFIAFLKMYQYPTKKIGTIHLVIMPTFIFTVQNIISIAPYRNMFIYLKLHTSTQIGTST